MELFLLLENLDCMCWALQLKRHLMTRSWTNLARMQFDVLENPKWQSTFYSLTCQSTWRVCCVEAFVEIGHADLLHSLRIQCQNYQPFAVKHIVQLEDLSMLKASFGGLENLTTNWNLSFEFQLAEHKQGLLANWRSLLSASQDLLANWWFLLSAIQGLLARESLLCASQGLLAMKRLLCASQGLLAMKSLLCASQALLANCIWNCWLQQLADLLKIPALFFLLWHSPQIWVFVESVLLLWISLSCPWLLNITWILFDKRFFRSCIQIQSFHWFATWFPTLFILWIANSLL